MRQLFDVTLAISTFKKPDNVSLFKWKVMLCLVQSKVISDISSLCDNRLVNLQFIDDGSFSYEVICDYFRGADT